MKKSLKKRIENYFRKRPGEWICGGEIQKLAMQAGYEAQNAGRRCRELAEANILKGDLRKGVRWYAFNDEPMRLI